MNIISDEIPYLSVIVPAYNEERIIRETLKNVIKYLSENNFNYEIIVVNDGSSDSTANIVSEITSLNSKVKLYNNKENIGKGWSVKKGILIAKSRYRLFMDADNSTSIEHFALMQPLLEKGADVVIGSRRVKGAEIAVHQSWIRENLGRVFNLFVRLINGLQFNDTQAGFKAFSSIAADRIFKLQTITRWSFDVELLVIAKHLDYKVHEVPIVWKNIKDSRVNLRGMINMIIDLIKIKIFSLSGKYDKDT